MKTLKLELKKKLLIVDAISQDIANGIIFQKFGVKTLSEFEFICRGSELTEEIASELVDDIKLHKLHFVDYKNNGCYKTNSISSFISAVESKGFHWLDNPISDPNKIIQTSLSFKKFTKHSELFDRAEEKTFRNPLIFVEK